MKVLFALVFALSAALLGWALYNHQTAHRSITLAELKTIVETQDSVAQNNQMKTLNEEIKKDIKKTVGFATTLISIVFGLLFIQMLYRRSDGNLDWGIFWGLCAIVCWIFSGFTKIWLPDDNNNLKLFVSTASILNSACFLMILPHIEGVFSKGFLCFSRDTQGDGLRLTCFPTVTYGHLVWAFAFTTLVFSWVWQASQYPDFILSVVTIFLLGFALWHTFDKRGLKIFRWISVVVLVLTLLGQVIKLLDWADYATHLVPLFYYAGLLGLVFALAYSGRVWKEKGARMQAEEAKESLEQTLSMMGHLIKNVIWDTRRLTENFSDKDKLDAALKSYGSVYENFKTFNEDSHTDMQVLLKGFQHWVVDMCTQGAYVPHFEYALTQDSPLRLTGKDARFLLLVLLELVINAVKYSKQQEVNIDIKLISKGGKLYLEILSQNQISMEPDQRRGTNQGGALIKTEVEKRGGKFENETDTEKQTFKWAIHIPLKQAD